MGQVIKSLEMKKNRGANDVCQTQNSFYLTFYVPYEFFSYIKYYTLANPGERVPIQI